MKLSILNQIVAFIPLLFMLSCSNDNSAADESTHEHAHQPEKTVQLSSEQFRALDIKIGGISKRNLNSVIEANGELEVPPQNEATVTAIVGANISSIKVIEGDDVHKGQVLAYLSHPNITELQSKYLETYNRLSYLQQDFQRQKRLYEEEVGSGKAFQKSKSKYEAAKSTLLSYETQLRQLAMDSERIREGNLYENIPVVSPIEGSITKVGVKIGQYVQPDKGLFELVNIDHIHADLMVFEKDIYKVEEGQKVRFQVETLPGEELEAVIYSVGKQFERAPKAVHVHAEIENKKGKLIPGMYIKGEIITDTTQSFALPSAAITQEGDEHFVFHAEKDTAHGEWIFTPIRVKPGLSNNEWVEIKFLEAIGKNPQFALNNAYYLIAEMKKGKGGHGHAH